VTEKERDDVFVQWLDAHKTLIFKVVRAYAKGAIEADDLFQEVAIRVWRSIPSFQGRSSPGTWIYRIALNTAITWVNREGRQATEPIESVQHLLIEKPANDERLNWLYDQIHRMDSIDKSLALLLLDGFSYKEMAGLLGITETHVGVKINRIKKRLVVASKKM